MEWKIGEIRQINGEWYQCIEGDSCGECSLFATECGSGTKSDLADKVFGQCSKVRRFDNKHAIFKKLEKVGEPYTTYVGKTVQNYLLETAVSVPPENVFVLINNEQRLIAIEIKQNKENMEENKTPLPREDNALTRTIYAYVNGKISDKELIRSIKEMSDEYPYDKNGLKPFSLEAAKAGKPVCTRDGRKARIICFDRKSHSPIIALVETFVKEYNSVREDTYYYTIDGCAIDIENESKDDLMVLPEKKEGWINICRNLNTNKTELDTEDIYNTKEEALQNLSSMTYVTTVKVEWEE